MIAQMLGGNGLNSVLMRSEVMSWKAGYLFGRLAGLLTRVDPILDKEHLSDLYLCFLGCVRAPLLALCPLGSIP